MKCERCDEEAKVISFCYDDYEYRDGIEQLCGLCHSDRVNSSRGLIFNFISIDNGKR